MEDCEGVSLEGEGLMADGMGLREKCQQLLQRKQADRVWVIRRCWVRSHCGQRMWKVGVEHRRPECTTHRDVRRDYNWVICACESCEYKNELFYWR